MEELITETKDKILASAKIEFLKNGYTKASLRKIAGNAGLTTGAMYRHFSDKDALFNALVTDAVNTTKALLKNTSVSFHESEKSPVSYEHGMHERQVLSKFIEYIYSNFDAFTLLLTKSAGSSHENFLQEVSDIYSENCVQIVKWMEQEGILKRKLNEMSVHIIATTMISSFAEIILHKMDKENAYDVIGDVQRFFEVGFRHLTEV